MPTSLSRRLVLRFSLGVVVAALAKARLIAAAYSDEVGGVPADRVIADRLFAEPELPRA